MLRLRGAITYLQAAVYKPHLATYFVSPPLRLPIAFFLQRGSADLVSRVFPRTKTCADVVPVRSSRSCVDSLVLNERRLPL